MGLAAPGPWLWLGVAGLLEVAWVVLLKRSAGFTLPVAGALCLLAMAASLWCMSQALRVLPMGTVYAVWTGIGAAGGVFWGIALEGEPPSMARIGCVGLILAGVAGLRLLS